ncbi:YhcN/YlaJ family sporulation lipoprotein [Anoxybacillus sp. LAT_35]|uniref:YhcN/YlaJ family sporulation lipoprotein n=1 Tax=unclassified Anoxybacillus TaxID=2639704 RepID=UPI001EDBCCB1|nr:YhcN/YlaJ family sporulation lipoprotein [Anoxybacillus sp. LAT_26]MCG3083627.1 YhcN/YlaJ family sporulation lipoprotein [Anoxybacillus sp. LAT27]MCG5025268.1 YhcN/YlaJ family sporulation lipoprotein [Anoxybacillus flavithermus]MCG6171422.1 YhcN/YlaJ family sporulation lipoprotein [Anoxybacillus sp. LAT_11]MCG6175331.1 YhcN/YlaJ family sporulation lipoprotein [Anoxybacillus sp. LAT_31]MCG6178757.1 YhcN/YlaJ family sporulation lipoprotein [Anoxybacillus sp. LAT_35]MCG6179292.1 YhcN/YlaJ fam
MERLKYIIIFMLLFISACGQQTQPNDRDSLIHVKNTTNEKIVNKSGQQIARHLAHLASSVPNVNDATVLVVGKYALVGIDVNAKLDPSRVGTVKYSVVESLQKDPYGANAIVIADADLNTRLKAIQKQVEKGKPIQGFMDELAAIVGRVMPEIPSDFLQTKNPRSTRQNDKQLNDGEQQQLENEQQKQSNDHMK